MRDNGCAMPVPVPPPPPELQPHYYRDNFARLLETVESQYGDLLAPGERAFPRRWRALGFAAQCLYVRLVSRVGPWFREAKLEYPEIGPSQPPLEELLAAGLATVAARLDLAEVDRLCTRAELIRQCALAPARKPELLQALEARGETPESLCAMVSALDGARVIAPLCVETVALFQLLFFGNRRQDMTEFVLSDLGVSRYYPYLLDRSQRRFASREAVEEYLMFAGLSDTWRAIRETAPVQGACLFLSRLRGPRDPVVGARSASDSAGEAGEVKQLQIDLAALVLDTPAQFSTSQGRRDRLCNRIARQLEREDELELALRLYRQSDTHPARERAARVLERMGEEGDALALVESAGEAHWCEEERDAMGRIGDRLRRRLRGQRAARPRDAFTVFDLELPAGGQRVERIAAAHLSAHWREVHYVENALMNSLFGLAFWEQIFAPVPGAFANPFQSAPLDMFEPAFYRQRSARIEARLEELAQCDLQRELVRAWREYHPFQCRWTDWRRVDEALVARAAALVPGAQLLAIWRRQLFDPGENRRGFPDLIAFGAAPGEYCMIEVKSPGDRLQESQRRWLRFFAAADIPAAVAQVRWSDG